MCLRSRLNTESLYQKKKTTKKIELLPSEKIDTERAATMKGRSMYIMTCVCFILTRVLWYYHRGKVPAAAKKLTVFSDHTIVCVSIPRNQ